MKENLKPYVYKLSAPFFRKRLWRAYCIMSRRVTVGGEVNAQGGSQSESESEQGVESSAVDPKPRELSMGRLQPL